jgi:hypothetical protein
VKIADVQDRYRLTACGENPHRFTANDKKMAFNSDAPHRGKNTK